MRFSFVGMMMCVLVACGSKGATGPAGPTGPAGAAGAAGAAGTSGLTISGTYEYGLVGQPTFSLGSDAQVVTYAQVVVYSDGSGDVSADLIVTPQGHDANLSEKFWLAKTAGQQEKDFVIDYGCERLLVDLTKTPPTFNATLGVQSGSTTVGCNFTSGTPQAVVLTKQ